MAGKVDYEAAWNDWQEKMLTRDGWGTKTMAAEMADIAVKNRVPEGPLERLLRLHGGRLARLIASHINAEEKATALTGTTPGEREPDPARVKSEEDAHDGRTDHTTARA